MSVRFLLSAFLLISGSVFGATLHDAAHNAFMTLPRHTSTREDEVQPVVEGALRHPPQAWGLVEHGEGVYS